MTRPPSRAAEPDLRQQAEDRLRKGDVPETSAWLEADARRLVHELQVHQIELELQNEQLRTAHDAFEQIARKFEDLYDFAPVGYLTLDPDGIVRAINLTGAKLLGMERSKLVGRNLAPFMAQEGSAALTKLLGSTFGRQEKATLEFTVERAEQPAVVLRLDAAPATPDHLCRAALSDVTELRRTQAEHEQSETLHHERKAETLRTLVGGIAHDFNNILTPILAYAELARMEVDADSPAQRDLTQITQAAERAKELVIWLLAAGRSDRKASLVPLALEPVLQETVQLARASMPKAIQIDVVVTPGCGNVLGDPTQIQRVLLNLMGNARDAMEGAVGTLTVTLRPATADEVPAPARGRTAQGRWVVLSVADTGTGVAPEMMDRLFDPYFTTKPHGKGSGLGLAVVQGLVATMGGEIRVHNRQGPGAQFDVLLPETTQARTTKATRPKRSTRGAGQHILLVEDEPAIREVLERMLDFLGYRVTSCANAGDALAVMQSETCTVDAVLTDCDMPGMSGLELAAELLRQRPRLPIVMGTGFSEAVNEQTAHSHGLRGLIMKPYTLQRVGDALAAGLTPRDRDSRAPGVRA